MATNQNQILNNISNSLEYTGNTKEPTREGKEYMSVPENGSSERTRRSNFSDPALLSTESARLRLLLTSPICGAN